jgi:hypothetical protein
LAIQTRPSQQITLTAALIAIGAAARIGVGNVALNAPEPLFGILIKIGLTETLTFITGYAFGIVPGFVAGASIIVISDAAMLPGAWTPFIAGIIGIIGVCAGLIRRVAPKPSFALMGVSAIILTILSELLQNAWVALFYNVPFLATMITGLSSMIAALINNFVLFTTVGLRVARMILHSSGRSN